MDTIVSAERILTRKRCGNEKSLNNRAAGFIGSHLCDRFIKEGFYVIGLDSFITGSPDNIARLIGNERFKFIKYKEIKLTKNRLDFLL